MLLNVSLNMIEFANANIAIRNRKSNIIGILIYMILLAKLTNLSVFLKNNPRSLAIPLQP
jgi:hypothetical protein